MKNTQYGFAPLVLLLIILAGTVVVGGGYYVVSKLSKNLSIVVPANVITATTDTKLQTESSKNETTSPASKSEVKKVPAPVALTFKLIGPMQYIIKDTQS